MTEYLLSGFVADTVGDEGHLIEAAPVVTVDEQLWLARGTRWSRATLKLVSEQDRGYLSIFAGEDVTPIHEGDTVWVAGRNFFQDVSAFEELKFQDLSMASWKNHSRGQRWSAGSTSAFDEFAVRLANFFEGKLHNYLFDRLEKSLGHAETAFRVYNALPIDDSPERELNRALYFFEVRDMYSYRFVKAEALAGKLFSDEAEFDASFARLRRMLREMRLSEGVVAPNRVHSGWQKIFVSGYAQELLDPTQMLLEMHKRYRTALMAYIDSPLEALEQAERHAAD